MPKPREPLPSPLDAVKKMLETGAVGGGGRPPEPETPAQNSVSTVAQNSANTIAEDSASTVAENSANTTTQNSASTVAQKSASTVAQNSARPPRAAPRTNSNGLESQTFFLTPALRRRLKAYAGLQGRELSEVAEQALAEYLARNE